MKQLPTCLGPRCHVLVLVVVGELVHVLDNLVDAHLEEVSNGGEHPASHLAERLPGSEKAEEINVENVQGLNRSHRHHDHHHPTLLPHQVYVGRCS